MFTKEVLSKGLLLFDIETASQTKELNELSPRMRELWAKRSEYLRSIQSHPENKEMSDSELYVNKSALQAEFGRVVCVSFAMIKFKDGDIQVLVKSVFGEDEKEVLEKAFTIINKAHADNKFVKLCGHNIKRFDIPFLGKRAVINGLSLPDLLKTLDKKPWELQVLDTADLWSFGAWQEGFASLDLISACLGIESPKDEMDGSKVTELYWNGKVREIAKYCGKDVVALAKILLKLSNNDIDLIQVIEK